jgi:hypothetical protein
MVKRIRHTRQRSKELDIQYKGQKKRTKRHIIINTPQKTKGHQHETHSKSRLISDAS